MTHPDKSPTLVLMADQESPPGKPMEFRLTYEGPLYGSSNGNPRAGHKHEVRRKLHPQLRRLWGISAFADKKHYLTERGGSAVGSYLDYLKEQYARFGYNFCPLLTNVMLMRCEIDILFLRPDPPGKLLQSGDIDNRLKTVFDALKMPSSLDEAGGKGPQEDESPFFVLLEDDKLISSVSIKTDTLLEPTSSAMTNDISDARLVIHVRFWPIRATWSNIDFI